MFVTRAPTLKAREEVVTAGIELAVQRHYALGSIYNPDYEFTSNANLWAQTVAVNSIAFNAVSRAAFSRGYLEEAFTIDGNWGAFQGAGTTTDGTAQAVYQVAEHRRYRFDDPAGVDVLQPTDDSRLTLITCGGTFDRASRSYDQRDVVIALRVI